MSGDPGGPPFFLNGPAADEIDAAVLLAKQWAVLMGDPAILVNGEDYSSKQWATWSQQYALEAQQAKTDAENALAAALLVRTTVPYVMPLTDPATSPSVNTLQTVFNLTPGTIKKLHVGILTTQVSGSPLNVEFSTQPVNGGAATVIGNVTIPNGDFTATMDVSIFVDIDIRVTAKITTIGAGGAGVRASYVMEL